MLTQDELKARLDYNELTGDFFWSSRSLQKAGTIHSRGYIQIKLYDKFYFAHRLAWLYMYGAFPDDQIDHINHNKTDNRIFNLRSVTPKENSRNRGFQSNNTSGVVGVCWDKVRGIWVANIMLNKKSMYLGSFNSKIDAAIARKMAEYDLGFHANHGI